MTQAKFIDKNEALPKALDYHFLKSQGLDFIQQLAGERWTDFNEHDPGVTILEQLSYALTELGYRSNMDFADLLASQQKTRQGTQGKDTFYPARKILTTNPITPKDFRKLIIDRIDGVRNIWIEPLNSFTKRKNIKGLYLAFVQHDSRSHKTQEEVKLEVRKMLNLHSNLGEAFEDVIMLKRQDIYLKCTLELQTTAIAEKVHAEVMFELERLTTRPLRFYSFNEMLERGIPVNKIFDGPMLKNGFLRDQFLKDKDSVFYSNQLLNVIRKVPGIKAIKYFNILTEDKDEHGNPIYRDYHDDLAKKVIDDVVVIKLSHTGRLGARMYHDANNPEFFSYIKDGAPVQLFQREVDKNLKALKARVEIMFRQKRKQTNDFDLPTGEPYEVEKYHSIQHHFPNIYGLSKYGIPSKASALRKAQIYQLKAYLLFFEQIMSNYLAQLSRFTELYSLDPSLTTSYFVQVPWDIPHLYSLVKGLGQEEPDAIFEQKFENTVASIMSDIDNFNHRRRAFITHLMARFGDDSFNSLPEKFNYYYTRQEHQQKLLKSSLLLLKNYVDLSSNKARSFDHTSIFWKDELDEEGASPNISTVEKKARILLGVPMKTRKIATDLLSEVSFDISHAASARDVQKLYPNYQLKLIPDISEGLWVKEFKPNHKTDAKLIDAIRINEDLLRRGIWDDNLQIIKTGKPKKRKYLLLFRLKEDLKENKERFELKDQLAELIRKAKVKKSHQKAEVLLSSDSEPMYCFEFLKDDKGDLKTTHDALLKVLGSYKTRNEAFKAAHGLKRKLLKLNKQSEGFYLLDHVLLRPRSKKVRINILLNDPTSDWSFRLTKPHSISEIESGIKADIQLLRTLDHQLQRKKDLILIVWKDGDRMIGRCNQKFKTEKAAHLKASEIKTYFHNFSDFDIYSRDKLKFKREIEDGQHPLHHYSFTATVMLNGWSARFCDPEFRYLTESIFRKNTPAHIALNFKWLNLVSMARFEELYGDWLEENRKDQIDFNHLNNLSDQLMSFASRT